MAMTVNDIDDYNDDIFEEDPVEDGDNYQEENQDVDPFDDEDFSEDYEDGEIYGDPEGEDDDANSEESITDKFLRTKGINPRAVKFESSDGYTEQDFNDLSEEEQLQILQSSELDDDYGLTDDEINVINSMRRNNWSPSDYNNYIANLAIKNYVSQQQSLDEPIYNIDNFSDEELYLIDLKQQIPDITDEEAYNELDNAKLNPEVFNKRIQSLREEYKDREDSIRERAEADAKAAADAQMEQFSNTILNTIEQNSVIDLGDSSLEMSNEDKNVVANFLLGKDQAGVRHVARALNDPKSLVEMAWYLTRGREAFNTLQNYYKQKITETARRNYTKGYEDASGGRKANSAKAVVKRSKKNAPLNRELTIDDID